VSSCSMSDFVPHRGPHTLLPADVDHPVAGYAVKPAAGPKLILVSFIIYAPATILFVMARRERGRQLVTRAELVILAVTGAVTV